MSIKLTESRLRQIIREEVKKSVLREASYEGQMGNVESAAMMQAAKVMDNERWQYQDHNKIKCPAHIVMSALKNNDHVDVANRMEQMGFDGRSFEKSSVNAIYLGVKGFNGEPMLALQAPWDKSDVTTKGVSIYDDLPKEYQQKIDAVVKSYHQELDKRAQKIMSAKK